MATSRLTKVVPVNPAMSRKNHRKDRRSIRIDEKLDVLLNTVKDSNYKMDFERAHEDFLRFLRDHHPENLLQVVKIMIVGISRLRNFQIRYDFHHEEQFIEDVVVADWRTTYFNTQTWRHSLVEYFIQEATSVPIRLQFQLDVVKGEQKICITLWNFVAGLSRNLLPDLRFILAPVDERMNDIDRRNMFAFCWVIENILPVSSSSNSSSSSDDVELQVKAPQEN